MTSTTLRACLAPVCASAALLCDGCLRLGPDFEPPAWDGIGRWDAPADAAPPLPDGAPWWTLFGDETLDRLEEALLGQNPSLAASVARLDAAAARLGIARAEALPSAALSASTVWKRDSKEDDADSRQKADWLLSPGASVQWEFDFWGRVRRTREAAAAEHSAAARDAGAARLLLSAQLASTYVSLRTLQAQLACARTNEMLWAQTVDLVRSRRRSGLSPELDLHQAEMELAGARAAIPALEARRDAALHAICALVGDWPGALDALLAPAPSPRSARSSGPPTRRGRRRTRPPPSTAAASRTSGPSSTRSAGSPNAAMPSPPASARPPPPSSMSGRPSAVRAPRVSPPPVSIHGPTTASPMKRIPILPLVLSLAFRPSPRSARLATGSRRRNPAQSRSAPGTCSGSRRERPNRSRPRTRRIGSIPPRGLAWCVLDVGGELWAFVVVHPQDGFGSGDEAARPSGFWSVFSVDSDGGFCYKRGQT